MSLFPPKANDVENAADAKMSGDAQEDMPTKTMKKPMAKKVKKMTPKTMPASPGLANYLGKKMASNKGMAKWSAGQ